MEEKKVNHGNKGRLKYSIEDMQAIAKAKGGKCLSDEYKGIMHKLQWQCKEGHTWFAGPNNLINGNSWCPVCRIKIGADKLRRTIEQMKQFAIEKGGKCLSDIYVNNRSKLQWQCSKGHVWNARLGSISRGSWCPKCSANNRGNSQRGNLQEEQGIAIKRGGKCLSKEYINSNTKLEWQCAKGHIWKAKPGNVNAGTWCPFCKDNAKQSMEAIQLIAQKYGGKCLSKEYIRGKKLTWECAEGHVWERTLDAIKRQRWCKICRKEERIAA